MVKSIIVLISVARLGAVVTEGLSDGCEPIGRPAVEFTVSAAASLQQLVLVVETRGIRGDAAKEVCADEDRVIGRRSWCRVGKGNHAV